MDLIEQFLRFDIVWEARESLLGGFFTTIRLTVTTFVLALVPGLLIAVARIYGPSLVKAPLFALVSFIRSIPAVVGIVFVFFALPFVGITLESFTSVVVTLTFIQAVYFSEVFRGGLLAIGKGQFEAAYSIGLETRNVYWKIILPQAFSVAAPSFASSIVQLVHNTTVSTVIALEDLLAASLSVQYVFGSPAALLPAAALYLLFLLPLVRTVRRREERMSKARS